MNNLTFIQYLTEQSQVDTDVEDLTPDELNKRAAELRRQAQIKKTNPEMAKRKALMSLREKLRAATDPRQKADIQRRIRELMTQDNAQNETV